MAAMAIGRDLQHPALVADGVVVTDLPLLLNAKDVLEEVCERHERRAGLFRRPGEASVVPGKVVVGEKAIGRVHAGDTGEPKVPSAGDPAALRTSAPSGRGRVP